MSEFLTVLCYAAALLFPFAMMPLLWRRMKRVRSQTYTAQKIEPAQTPWEAPTEREGGLTITRPNNPNEELIALGDRGRHARWPIDNP